MVANIYIYCPSGVTGLDRDGLEEELESFSGDAAEDSGAGGGGAGFNLDYDLVDGEDPHAWADRLRSHFSRASACGPARCSTYSRTAGSRAGSGGVSRSSEQTSDAPTTLELYDS